jgi:hypothetical protein
MKRTGKLRSNGGCVSTIYSRGLLPVGDGGIRRRAAVPWPEFHWRWLADATGLKPRERLDLDDKCDRRNISYQGLLGVWRSMVRARDRDGEIFIFGGGGEFRWSAAAGVGKTVMTCPPCAQRRLGWA